MRFTYEQIHSLAAAHAHAGSGSAVSIDGECVPKPEHGLARMSSERRIFPGLDLVSDVSGISY
ncbi:MAG TPA: hypothetical protein VD927_18535, partial [Chryseosolibacter sp.]|nr:hypothetical protein [Chryseosolibacter sp.]